MNKKVIIEEESENGGSVTIEHEVGNDYYLLHLGNKSLGLSLSKNDLLILQKILAEILEN